jgi:outer membrane protein OmpA-like peptidoglycan-associated protein
MRTPLTLPLLLGALTACAAPAAQGPGPVLTTGGGLLRAAELARVRCLLLAPLENSSDAPDAAAAATAALVAGIDPTRTSILPVADLRALFLDTPLELAEGVGGSTALELAELLGADAALYGAVEGSSRERDPDVVVTLRLVLAGHRDLLFAATVPVERGPGEPFNAAVRRAVLAQARPALDRLGAPGRSACFPRPRRDALRTAAVSLGAPTPAPRAAPSRPTPAPRAVLHTDRQKGWAAALLAKGRVPLEDLSFAGRTAALARDGGLADLAVVLRANPDLTVRLEGFVDATGDPAGDRRLSQAMAQAAQRRLEELGVEATRVSLSGRGGESPIVPNFTARGRAANRRVEVVSPR